MKLKEFTMETIKDLLFTGERCLFKQKDTIINNCIFYNGESPLKESNNLEIINSSFFYKYPLWYSNNIKVINCRFYKVGKSGIWYTNNISLKDTIIDAPKEFRKSNNISLENVIFNDASETLWNCKDVKLKNIKAKGDYFLMNSKNIKINNLKLDGNYCFDGGNNIEISDSILNSKDAFWNANNVIIKNSIIKGEYFGWNSENITLINCSVTSHQGFCYMNNIKLINCQLIDTDLSFEYSKNIDADIISNIIGVKNPISGIIKAPKINKLILDPKETNKDLIRIITND